MLSHRFQLLLLKDLHQTLFQRFADQNFQNGLDLEVKVEDLPALYLCLHVDARLHGNEPGRGGPVEEGVGLGADFGLGHGVRELLQVSVRLYVHVSPPVDGLRRARPLKTLNDLLGPPRGLHEGFRGQDLRRVRVSSNDATVKHNVGVKPVGLVALAVLWPPARAHGLRLRRVDVRLRRDHHLSPSAA